jgi:hypothetical protein
MLVRSAAEVGLAASGVGLVADVATNWGSPVPLAVVGLFVGFLVAAVWLFLLVPVMERRGMRDFFEHAGGSVVTLDGPVLRFHHTRCGHRTVLAWGSFTHYAETDRLFVLFAMRPRRWRIRAYLPKQPDTVEPLRSLLDERLIPGR